MNKDKLALIMSGIKVIKTECERKISDCNKKISDLQGDILFERGKLIVIKEIIYLYKK